MSKIDLPHWYVGKEDVEAEGNEISVLDDSDTKDVLPLEDIKPDAPVAPKSRLGPVPDFLKQSFEVKNAKENDDDKEEDDDKQDNDKQGSPKERSKGSSKGSSIVHQELLEEANMFTSSLVASPMTTTRSKKVPMKAKGAKTMPMKKKKKAKPKASAKAKAKVMPTVPTMVPYL